MPAIETKRRGRPPKAHDHSVEIEDAAPAEPERPSDPDAPKCHRCGDAMETSRTLLRAYGMTCHRCVRCREVAIEGDAPFDFLTALSGDPPLLVERAAALYAAKHLGDLPAAPDDPDHAAMHSEWDDARWTTPGD